MVIRSFRTVSYTHLDVYKRQGPKCTDLEHGVEYPTIARQAIAAQLLTEMLSEEMRLLYVAMTRA